jgi:hypothetical protein
MKLLIVIGREAYGLKSGNWNQEFKVLYLILTFCFHSVELNMDLNYKKFTVRLWIYKLT